MAVPRFTREQMMAGAIKRIRLNCQLLISALQGIEEEAAEEGSRAMFHQVSQATNLANLEREITEFRILQGLPRRLSADIKREPCDE